MANEAIIRNRLQDPIDFICANANGIEKGAILELSDPRTASGAITCGVMVAGIAAREKIASDGRTTIPLFQQGVFDVVASGAIAVGNPVKLGLSNVVVAAIAANQGASGAIILGTALEEAAHGEVFQN